jgi:hypothetical protein
MSPPRDRRKLREDAHARARAAFLDMLPKAAEVLEQAAKKGDRRALRLLERIERERPDLLPSAIRSTKEQEGARTRAAS